MDGVRQRGGPERGLWPRLGGPLLLLASLSLALGLGELGARLLGVGPIAFGPGARLIARDGSLLLDCYSSNPRGYFDVDLREPATRARYASRGLRVFGLQSFDAVVEQAPYAVELRFNSLGLREREPSPHRPGVLRVAVLGDSFTQGQGVRDQDSYPRLLEALLEAHQPGRWEVYNWGRRAADFPALRESFEELRAWQPDLVVYGMVLNDPEQSEAFRLRQPYLGHWILEQRRRVSLSQTRGTGGSRLLAALRDRLEAWRIGRESTRWYRELYGPENAGGWARTRASIAEMGRELRGSGGYLLLASWPLLVDLESYPFADIHAQVGRFCIEQGIDWVDLLPALAAGPPTRELWVHGGDRHPNPIAQRLAAERLLEPVLEIGRRLQPPS